jgi:hypothetical protein
MTLRRWLVLVSISMLPACVATSTDPNSGNSPAPPMMRDGGVARPGPGGGVPSDMGMANPGMVQPPRLGPMPSTTYWPSLPLHGQGPPGGTVLIDGASGTQQPVDVSQSGQFCADVKLAADSANQLSVRAVDTFGNVSDPVMVMVQQSGTPPESPAAQPSVNASLGGSASANLDCLSCDPTVAMIDGDLSTSYTARRALVETSWVEVQLVNRSNIDHIHVVSPASCPLSAYTVLVSNKDAPSAPSKTDSANWQVVKAITGSKGEDTIGFQPMPLTTVAVIFDVSSCGTVWYSDSISEIEAYTVADMPPPPLTAPTCNGGG